MALVSMTRLRLFGLLQDRDALFEKLQQLGCVEVSQPDGSLSDPQWASLVRPGESTRSEKERMLEETDAALSVLGTYAPEKSKLLAPKPQVLEDGRSTITPPSFRRPRRGSRRSPPPARP